MNYSRLYQQEAQGRQNILAEWVFKTEVLAVGFSMNVAAKQNHCIRYKYVCSMGSQQAITWKAHFSFLMPREL